MDGVIERPRTGEKQQVRSLRAVGRAIEQMLERDRAEEVWEERQ